MAFTRTFGTDSIGPTLFMCRCCVEHGGDKLLDEIVTCPVCGDQCSCEGCVADADASRKEQRDA